MSTEEVLLIRKYFRPAGFLVWICNLKLNCYSTTLDAIYNLRFIHCYHCNVLTP